MNFRTLAVVLLVIGYVSGASANEDELNGVPKEYWDLKNPFTATDENLGDGKALYEAFCVRCHGVHGLADGPDSDKFNPPRRPWATPSICRYRPTRSSIGAFLKAGMSSARRCRNLIASSSPMKSGKSFSI